MRNAIIRKLSDQAVGSIPEFVDFKIPDSFKNDFAKLVVKECLAIIQCAMDYHEDGDGFNSLKCCRLTIKEHFSI